MAKNNIRSVRFSDEMIEIINQQVGDNFTQKFERMVYNCYMMSIPAPAAAGLMRITPETVRLMRITVTPPFPRW